MSLSRSVVLLVAARSEATHVLKKKHLLERRKGKEQRNFVMR